MIKLYSYSAQNRTHGYSDTGEILSGQTTDMDAVVEYAARVCYKSTARMGDSGNFIQKLVDKGHEDVVEHGYAVFRVDENPYETYREAIWFYRNSRYINVTLMHNDDDEAYVLVGANLRTWLQIARRVTAIGSKGNFKYDFVTQALGYLIHLAPSVFFEFVDEYKFDVQLPEARPFTVNTHYSSSSPGTVTLLAASNDVLVDDNDEFIHATFLIEHVSRALSHQLVRYRLLSFSQESQRYVDLEKGDWGIVVPPSFDELEVDSMWSAQRPFTAKQLVDRDFSTRAIQSKHMELTEEAYRELRKAGVRKEDARMLLPNATETRLVVSGTLEGWRNAIWQRCAKSAQWEIRGIFMEILKILYQLYPSHFENEYYTFIGEGNDQVPA